MTDAALQKPAAVEEPAAALKVKAAEAAEAPAAAAAAANGATGDCVVAAHHLTKRPELHRVESVVRNDSLCEEEVEHFFAPEAALEEEERLRKEREEAEAAAAAADPAEVRRVLSRVAACCLQVLREVPGPSEAGAGRGGLHACLLPMLALVPSPVPMPSQTPPLPNCPRRSPRRRCWRTPSLASSRRCSTARRCTRSS